MNADFLKKMSDVLINYSLKIKRGDLFLIRGEDGSLPLIKEVYKLAIDKGAYPYIKLKFGDLEEYYLKQGSHSQLRYYSDIEKYEMKKIDVILNIIGTLNTCNLRNVPSDKIALRTKSYFPIRKIYFDRTGKGELRWCVTLYPTNALAQDAGMSLDEFENFVYNACKLNYRDPSKEWEKVSRKQQQIVNYLNKKNSLKIVGKDINLKIKKGNRRWINCDGRNNFPDGEIFTSPVEDSANGYIRFNLPQYYNNKIVKDIYLKFNNGKVVDFSAGEGLDFLKSILKIDSGATRLGEVAIGTNYNIRHQIKNILFDEKIGGTIHIALGASIKEAGGKNESSIHWDMIFKMGKEDLIYANDELIYKNGKFIL